MIWVAWKCVAILSQYPKPIHIVEPCRDVSFRMPRVSINRRLSIRAWRSYDEKMRITLFFFQRWWHTWSSFISSFSLWTGNSLTVSNRVSIWRALVSVFIAARVATCAAAAAASEDAAGCMIPAVLVSRERKSLVSGLLVIDEGEVWSTGNTVFEDPGSPLLALIGVPLRLEGYLVRIFGTGDDLLPSRRLSFDWK